MRNLFASLFLMAGVLFFSTSVYVTLSKPIERVTTTAAPLSSEELEALLTSKIVSRESASVAERAAQGGPRIVFPSSDEAALLGGPASKPVSAPPAIRKKGKSSKAYAKGLDGGMNQVFASAPVASQREVEEGAGNLRLAAALADKSEAANRDCNERMLTRGVVSSGPCIDIDEIVRKLAVGTYTFNKPAKAFVGEPIHIALVLKTAPTQEVGSFFAGLAGKITSKEGRFAQFVSASMRGDDLAVEPTGLQNKTATSEEPVEWNWVLTPSAAGERTLLIEVLAQIQVGSKQIPVTIRTLREPIVISISYFQQAKTYAASLNGYILAASGAFTALAGIFGFIPSIRNFVIGLFRRRPEFRRYGR